ncbi:hypothetical protein Fcan01_24224, partial [Folsomia candida]
SNPGQSEEGPVALSPSPQVPTIGENQQLQALSAKVQALTEKVQALAENSQGRRLPATRQVKVLPTTSQVPVHTQTRPQTCHIPLKTETAPDRYNTTWRHAKDSRQVSASPPASTTHHKLTHKQVYEAKKFVTDEAIRQIQARLIQETRLNPNFMFVLYLWRSKLRNSKVLLYTDNFEFFKFQTPYGIGAQRLVRHLKVREGIEVQVEVSGTNEAGIVNHAKFVKPADDFSRNRFKDGCDFLVDYFGVKQNQLTGSYLVPTN